MQNGEDFPRKKLEGKAGNAGWFEVARHLPTGQDNLGRIYVRKGTVPGCNWDVVVHLKKNDVEQNRFIVALSKRGPFSERTPF